VRKLLVLGGLICAAAIAWQFSPVPPDQLLERAQGLRNLPLAPLWVPIAYALLGLVMFPFVALRVGTLLVFGPFLGPLYAVLGVALSAIVGYEIGRRVGARDLEGRLGPRAEKLRQRVQRGGILAVAAARMVPMGPFALVNAFAGAVRVPRRDFLIGTILGTTPGLLLLLGATQLIGR